MVAVAAKATAARMRPAKRPRVRVFILACFLAYFFLGGAGTAGALVCGIPGIWSFTSQPQSSPAFLAVFWYSISLSMMILRFGHSMVWGMRRPLMNMVGVPEMSRARASSISFSTSACVALLSMQAPSLMESTSLASLAQPNTWALRFSGVMGVDPVVIFPEAVGLLLEDAAAGHGGRFGPGVEAFDGKVLEVEAHLGGVVLDQVLADHLGFALAERALHVAEQHDGDRGAGGSQSGLKLRLELVEFGLEGVGGDVVEIALHDLPAVVGNVERDFLELRALRDAHADFLEARKGARFGIANRHRQLRLQQIKVAHIGFQGGFVEGGLLRSVGGAEQKGAQ